MDSVTIVGIALVAGLVVFLVGAGGWRLAYEQPLEDALRVIADDRRRRSWIHLWMLPALSITSAGIAALVVVVTDDRSRVLVVLASVVYVVGAVCWVVSLLFRLAVVPWAAARTVRDGQVPDGFEPLNDWASWLYGAHMVSAYAAFGLLGAAVLASSMFAPWVGWTGVVAGPAFLLGIVATRFEGPFNPPFWAHTYTGLLGVLLLLE